MFDFSLLAIPYLVALSLEQPMLKISRFLLVMLTWYIDFDVSSGKTADFVKQI